MIKLKDIDKKYAENAKQIRLETWLNGCGGRTMASLKKDSIGRYVLMGDGKTGLEKVYFDYV